MLALTLGEKMELQAELLKEAGYEGVWSEQSKQEIDWWYTHLHKVGPIYIISANQYDTCKTGFTTTVYFDNYEEALREFENYI
jgi:hypothetical protein